MSAWGVASNLSLGRCRLYNLYHLTVLYHPRSAACSPGGASGAVAGAAAGTRPATTAVSLSSDGAVAGGRRARRQGRWAPSRLSEPAGAAHSSTATLASLNKCRSRRLRGAQKPGSTAFDRFIAVCFVLGPTAHTFERW